MRYKTARRSFAARLAPSIALVSLSVVGVGLGTKAEWVQAVAFGADLDRYESSESIRHKSAPRRARAESGQDWSSRDGRGYAEAEQTGVDNGSFRPS